MARKRTLIQNLSEGMILEADVLTQDGQLLVAGGTVITPRIIARLKFYGISYVYIEHVTVEPPKETSYYQRIEATHEFKKFNHTLKLGVSQLQQSINKAILYNEEVDTQELLEGVDKIVLDTGNGLRLMNMLQCIRSYDDMIYVHSLNVALICDVMSDWLHLDERDKKELIVAGLLHDIGKTVMPKELLSKTSKLTDEEYELIKKHTVRGYELVKERNLSQRVKLAILQHHERCDGKGYPYGLMTENITDFAKIVAIADVYDAMTSNRVYRQGICPFDVIETFEKEGFQKYDPKFLLPFLQRVSQCYINVGVKLSNGMEGEIIMLNRNHLSKPVVKSGSDYINLAERSDLTITSLL